jgi:hypothetical protein
MPDRTFEVHPCPQCGQPATWSDWATKPTTSLADHDHTTPASDVLMARYRCSVEPLHTGFIPVPPASVRPGRHRSHRTAAQVCDPGS